MNKKFSRDNLNNNEPLFLLISVIILLSALTYLLATRNLDYYENNNNKIDILLLVNLLIFFILLILTLKKFLTSLSEAKKTFKKSKLYFNTIISFTSFITIPITIVAIFSIIFFHYGIESWFNKKVNTAISGSFKIADLYLEEHKKNIRNDILAVKKNIDNEFFVLVNEPDEFHEEILNEADLRSLIEIMVFQNNRVLAQTSLSFPLALERLPIEELAKADKGDIVILHTPGDSKIRALVKLNSFHNTYLLIGRLIDENVIYHINKTKSAISEYEKLKNNINNLQNDFMIIFMVMALLIIIISVLLGIGSAGRIVRPIVKLIYAAGEIKSGNLEVRIDNKIDNDEIGQLITAFNLMAEQLQYQREELINANKQIDLRRLFTETILTGVSAGIIALNIDNKVKLVNKSALILLDLEEKQIMNYYLADILPEFNYLLEEIKNISDNNIVEQINLRRNGKKLVFLVKIMIEQDQSEVKGYVITFDDVTELVFAQRSAAWADIARRIAHEIKNPLTPISLAAQRLKRKFSGELNDSGDFIKYTDTITKHVTNINRIVEEFVNFARMPIINLIKNDIYLIIKEIIFSREIINNIEYRLITSEKNIWINCDINQIQQAMINLYKNAEESIEEKGVTGLIITKIEKLENHLMISVQDNGKGIQEEIFTNLTKPYITNKTIGTGLGLAIVKKILDDHNAKIEFENREDGLIVKVYLPYN